MPSTAPTTTPRGPTGTSVLVRTLVAGAVALAGLVATAAPAAAIEPLDDPIMWPPFVRGGQPPALPR